MMKKILFFTFAILSSFSFVSLASLPVADFTFEASGGDVIFHNQSIDATDYIWDFGDSSMSNIESPIHTYADTDASYKVQLIAINADGIDSFSLFVSFTCLMYILELDHVNDSILCESETDVLIAPNGFVNYQWMKDGASFRSTHENFIEIDAPADYFCIMTTASGCGAISNHQIFVQAPITENSIIASENIFIPGTTNLLQMESVAYNLAWSSGEYSDQIEVINEGVLEVNYENQFGCQYSSQIELVFNLDFVPTLSISENILKINQLDISKVSEINWYKNELLHATNLDSTIDLSESGNYKAVISFYNGLVYSTQSSEVELIVSYIQDFQNQSIIFQNQFIQTPDNKGFIFLYSLDGKLVHQEKFVSNQNISYNTNSPLIVKLIGDNKKETVKKVF